MSSVWVIESQSSSEWGFALLGVAVDADIAKGLVDAWVPNLVGWQWIDGIKSWEKTILGHGIYQISEYKVQESLPDPLVSRESS